MVNNDFSTITWLDGVNPVPTALEMTNGLNACLAAQSLRSAQILELSTTTTAVANLAAGYVGANAIQQIQVNKNMARIIQLRQLLGLQ